MPVAPCSRPGSAKNLKRNIRGRLNFARITTRRPGSPLPATRRSGTSQLRKLLNLGLFYLRRQLYAKAVTTLDTGVKHHPESIYLTLGLVRKHQRPSAGLALHRTCITC